MLEFNGCSASPPDTQAIGLQVSEKRPSVRHNQWKDKRRGEPTVADDELSDEERQWMDRLLNPLDGPASENAYPEDMMIEIDGKEVPMNSSSREYNRRMGYVDEAAHISWTPENAKSPEGSEVSEPSEERQPPEATGSIDIEDADTDKPEPGRQREELLASVREMGTIDCPCGWVGEATEARVVGSGSPLELLCPECGRQLFVLSIDE